MTKLTDQIKKEVESMISTAIKNERPATDDPIKKLSDKNTELENKIIEKDVAIEELQKSTSAAVENPWAEMVKKGKKSETSLKIINVVADENKERNIKEKNVIVFGLKESCKISVTEKKQEDKIEVTKILEELNLTEIEIEGIFWINSKDKSKPKPLIMVLKDSKDRNNELLAEKR